MVSGLKAQKFRGPTLAPYYQRSTFSLQNVYLLSPCDSFACYARNVESLWRLKTCTDYFSVPLASRLLDNLIIFEDLMIA